MNVLLIDDPASNANWGDRAAAISLKHMISQSGAHTITSITDHDLSHSSFHNVSESCQDNDSPHRVKETVKMFIPPLVLTIRDRLFRSHAASIDDDIIPHRWEDFEPTSKHIFNNKHLYSDLLTVIELSDVIVIHGCELHNNGRDYRAYLFLTYIAKRYFAKPVIIVNLTVDFLHPELRKMAEHLLPLFDDVVCRDVISAERCKGLCNGRFAPDTAFIFKPVSLHEWLPVSRRLAYFDVWPDTGDFDPAAPYICIGGSSIYMYTPQCNPVKGFSQLINQIMSIYSGQIILTVSGGPDEAWFKPIAAELKLPLIALRTPVPQAVDILGNAQAYIGGRWHPGIFALRGGTPIIPLASKTIKMQALAHMAGLSDRTFDALNLENEKDAIVQRLQSYLEQGDELRSRLLAWAEEESVGCWDNVAYLKHVS